MPLNMRLKYLPSSAKLQKNASLSSGHCHEALLVKPFFPVGMVGDKANSLVPDPLPPNTPMGYSVHCDGNFYRLPNFASIS